MHDTACHSATPPRRHPRLPALALALVTGLGALNACQPADTPARLPSEVRLTEPATFATAYDLDFEPGLLATMAKLGIVVSQDTRTDAYGTWNPLTLAPGAPLLDIPASLVADDVDPTVWTDQTLRQAWSALASFLVTEWLDSELVWDDTPGNREALAERLKTAGFVDQDATGAPVLMKNVAPGSLPHQGVTPWGPIMVDQDLNRWRQTGTPLPADHDPDPAVTKAWRTALQASLVPVEPAPYPLGQPRTLVDQFRLKSVTTVPGATPGQANFVVTMGIFRPVVTAAAHVPVYEDSQIELTVQVRLDAGRPRLQSISSFRGDRKDTTVISYARLLQLPHLDEPASAGTAASRPQALGHITFDLPNTAQPGDALCQTLSVWPADSSALTFTLPAASSALPGCLYANAYPSDGSFTRWYVAPDTTTWALAVGPLVGGIDVTHTYFGDRVMIQFFDPEKIAYDLRATVPAGTGRDFAAHLVASLTYTAPDATATVTPTPTTTP